MPAKSISKRDMEGTIMIGEKISELRKNKNLTQEELAGLIGVSAQSISKWENRVTMPDIMLLPVLAGALDVTVNDLFSIVDEKNTFTTINPDDAPECAYEAVACALMRGISAEETVSRSMLDEYVEKLRTDDRCQSGIVSRKNGNGQISGGTYINGSIALSYIKNYHDSVSLLENEGVVKTLLVLSDENVRKVLKYMLSNGNKTVTVAVAANKCGITVDEANESLEKLGSLQLIRIDSVDTGEEEPINVYCIWKSHRTVMTLFPLLELAEILANGKDCWMGLRS